MKYVLPGLMSDISESVEALFDNDIAPLLDPKVFAKNDDFRREHLYSPQVAATLLTHEPSLRNLFNAVARVATVPGTQKLGMLLGIAGWKTLVRRLELVDYDATERDASLCFITSRMVVIDGLSDKGAIKESSLPFEGFLEALARLALLKAWPTEAAVEASGHEDAAALKRWMTKEKPAQHKLLCEARAVPWGDEPFEPVATCVHFLMRLVILTIEEQAIGNASARGVDGVLTANEMKQWVAMFEKNKPSNVAR